MSALVGAVEDLLEPVAHDESRERNLRDRIASGVGEIGQAHDGPRRALAPGPRLLPFGDDVELGLRPETARVRHRGPPLGGTGDFGGLLGEAGGSFDVGRLVSRQLGDFRRGEVAGDVVAGLPMLGHSGFSGVDGLTRHERLARFRRIRESRLRQG